MLSKDLFLSLLQNPDKNQDQLLFQMADKVRRRVYDNKIYIRGLIEISNYCRNNCYYCGIRKDNDTVTRYRLDASQILKCCEEGYALGFRTFVLQGGEEASYADGRITRLIEAMKKAYPDCAITLSLGEWEKGQYQEWFDAGADRYLLRHETIRKSHYQMLHPEQMSYEHRKNCLFSLKEIGYQTGCGFMVGTRGQTLEDLVEELFFVREFAPEMVGIGPFLPHQSTPFHQDAKGSLMLTLRMLSLIRLVLPGVLLPATTALATINAQGQKLALTAGANVVMPNLSPLTVRNQYCLYDHKANMGTEAAEGIQQLKEKVEKLGYKIVVDRGDAVYL